MPLQTEINNISDLGMRRTDIEIMAPVGSWESLHAAIKGGADSVYFGVGQLNMRARSTVNFTLDDLGRIVETAHENNLKAYLTLNTIIYDDEMAAMRSIVDRAVAEGVDAVIASDQAAILYAAQAGMEVHISTQLNVSNLEAVSFFSRWADVMVLARELDLARIKAINEGIIRDDIRGPRGELVKIEMFAHGALCMAVSGKCYLSLHDNGHSANRGACRQICRRSFVLTDRETGEEIAVEGKYLLSPKDLCTLEFLDKFIDAGVRVLKIEGRARSADYVKRVCETYNEALRAIESGCYTPEKIAELTAGVSEVFNRGFWGGYYLGSPVPEITKAYGSSATKRRIYVGKVTNYCKKVGVAEIMIEAVPLERGREIIFTGETTGIVEMTANEIFVDEKPAEVALQRKYCSIKTPEPVRRGDKLYKIISADEL